MNPVVGHSSAKSTNAGAADSHVSRCVFCLSHGPFSSREYGTRTIPEGISWPAAHCFQGKTLAICSQCSGGFVHQTMKDEDISAFYSAIYDARHVARAPSVEDLNELNPRFLSQALYVKSFVDLRDGMRILEFGPNYISALPSLSLFCHPRFFYFDQTDSRIIARYGGKRLGPYASGAEMVRKCGEGQLDLVYASHSLEHVNPSSLDELLKGVFTALAPGGHFFFEVPDDLSISLLVVPHTLFFTESSMRRLLTRHGFEIVDLARWGTPKAPPNTMKPGDDGGTPVGPVPAASGSAWRSGLRRLLLGLPLVKSFARPLLLQRGLSRAIRRLPTPYEPTPYFRVIARKRQPA